MSDTTFVDLQAPAVNAAWLNDVNALAYRRQFANGSVANTSNEETWLTKFLPAGYVTDGSVDYTTYIQAALDSAKTVHAPEGTFLHSTLYFKQTGTISIGGATYATFPRLMGAGKFKTTWKVKAGSTYGFATYCSATSQPFGGRADGTAVTYTLGLEIHDCSIDINALSNSATVAAIAIEDTWDATLRNVQVLDNLLEASSRWGLWLGRALYTSATYSCTIGRILHKGTNSLANFGTTVCHYSLATWHTEHYYYQDLAYIFPTFQKDTDKMTFGAACGPLTLVGGDYEQGGYLIVQTVDGGLSNVSGIGGSVAPMYGNLFGGVAQTVTGTARPANTVLDFECQTRAPRAIASASRTLTTVTVNLVLTTANGFFKYMAPEIGELVTVAGTSTAMDGTSFVVTARTVTYPTVNQFTYSTVTSGAIGAVTTGTVTPDPAAGYRYSRMYGNNFGWDALAGRLLARQRLVMSNAQALVGFQTDGTTEKALIQLNVSNQLELGDGSTNRWILDAASLRCLMPGYGPQVAATVYASLPAAATFPYMRTVITDCNTVVFNAAAAGGGANKIPVWSDGTVWRVG
ncbi:hypothetical protein UFOVP2_50 [uncultured Caudovirales phage]|uniref:Uncharacterized protein n=1 Tax=uncultured Caudovirales phage TaxID=2100421 RepID=A0A6J5KIB2_9CAUD|nr:hypothetical protein UFOVP2_50 [uncultured Caudovirales phage]